MVWVRERTILLLLLLLLLFSTSGLENLEYGRSGQSRWKRSTLHAQMLALTSPTNCGRSVGIARSRTQATEF
jgi:hypothetical protein